VRKSAIDLAVAVKAIMYSQTNDVTFSIIDDQFILKGKSLAEEDTADDKSEHSDSDILSARWLEFEKNADSKEQLNARLKQLSAHSIKPFVTDRVEAEHDSLVYCDDSITGTPAVTSMQALHSSEFSINWIQYLHYKQKHPATRSALQDAITLCWRDSAHDIDTMMQQLKDDAKEEFKDLLKDYSEVHEYLNERVNEIWTHEDVLKLGQYEGLNEYTVPPYQTDVSGGSGRGICGILPLFVGLDDDNKLIKHTQEKASLYKIGIVYKEVIKLPPTSYMHRKGKGKR
jgi:hypothetical protein